ncbi:UNVERIFIED_CONTAM: hypothetical protein Sradi_1582200 [Sesamum radiatum]|uniref:Reverse transcriptase zinc-binding domain-containing protein n=1 Tax=Sesamum radiatum TaxID=300843 RepID=A0AAW2UBS3_SESRA
MVSGFWWSNRGNRKMHWISWHKLCCSKLEGGLGFRQLRLFNTAMLVKQLWRLLKFPNRLLSRVIRARYFSHGDIFSAQLGVRPSFTWRSLFSALPLFQSGCRWRVGSGNSIRIWEDPWLPRPISFKPITPSSGAAGTRFIVDLIDPVDKDWDRNKIEACFWPIDADLILSIPISRTGDEDVVWHYSTSGIFSVRSAYHLACDLENAASNSNRAAERDWWKTIWQAKLPGKVKIFIWRSYLNILPTSMNLRRRLSGSSQVCPHCSSDNEDTLHALLFCHLARQVTCFASRYLESFLTQNAEQAISRMQTGRTRWSCPPAGCVKLNFDGAVLEHGAAMGLEIVARDERGCFLGWLSRRINVLASGDMAEA